MFHKERGSVWLLARIALGAICLASCGSPALDTDVHQYLRLAVALGANDPDSIDYYYGPSDWVADIRKDPPRLDEIRREARQLASRLTAQKQSRAVRLGQQVRAIAVRADQLLGAKQNFDQETEAYFGVTAPPIDPNALNQVRARISQLLGGRGSLTQRYFIFDQKFLVPPERLQTVMARAIQGCRDQTRDHLRLPFGESVTIEYVHNKPWSAFSRYAGNFHSVIQVNADLPLTVDRALQLACHEGYPGHHAFNVLRELQFVRQNHWLEWMVQPAFSSASLVSESLATIATDIAFPEPERLRFERDALFPLAGLNRNEAARYDQVERLIDQLQSAEPAIARDFLDGKLEWARAAEALEEQVLMAHPETTLKYMNEYRSYMITYTLGRDLAARKVHSWQRYAQLITDPDAADTIKR